VIFVDSNIPMYLVGANDRYRVDAQRLLEQAVLERRKLVTSAEVLQEILHRYASINRREAIQPAFDALLGVVDEVFPVGLAEVERAKTILLGHPRLTARDAVHLATMERHKVATLLSFDAGFDGYPGVERKS
jgi:hypothetical protein